MKPLFKDAGRQQAFERDGYVKIPLLTQEQVARLVDAYAPLAARHEAIGIPYITTSHSNDAELITRVDDDLRHVLAPAMDHFLQHHNLLFGNYLLKMPVPGSETDPHQDITFVDEANYASVNVWVALQDTDETNGCMYFLPGSHTRISTLRPTHSYPWAYEQVKDEIRKRSKVYTAKAGEAFVFHHAVVHGSFANRSRQPRLAAVMAAYHSEAPLLHYYLPGGNGNEVHRYGMTKEAFLSFVKNNPPAKGTFLGTVQHDFHQLSLAEFRELYGEEPQKKTFRKLFSGWFNKTAPTP